MAYIEGTQNIPAEIYKQVKATIGTQAQTGLVKKRMPFRLPNMQEGGKHVRQSQINQRERFKSVVSQFNNEDMNARSRWYEAEPEYSSFLWYYNYFILSGLNGNANGQQGGYGVIKLIQNIATNLGTAGAILSIPTAIDPQKAVIMAWGAAHKMAYAPGAEYDLPYVWSIFPVPKLLNSSQLQVVWSETPDVAGNCSFIVIEYI
jgi:hypothetical protein